MTLGPVEPGTHVAEMIDLLAEDPDLAERTHYVIAGTADPADVYLRELATQITECGLAATVRMLGRLSPVEVDRCARAADVFVNLRHPQVEGCSMSLMYQLPFGRPVITYDSGSFAEVPDQAVAKVAIGDRSGCTGECGACRQRPTARGDRHRREALCRWSWDPTLCSRDCCGLPGTMPRRL